MVINNHQACSCLKIIAEAFFDILEKQYLHHIEFDFAVAAVTKSKSAPVNQGASYI
jgi:hypothetical protein